MRRILIHHFSFSAGSLPSERLSIQNEYDADAELSGVNYNIRDAVVADSGTYQCKASNKHTTVIRQVTIEVRAGSIPA